MPAFMTIGKFDGGELVEPGEFKGDATAVDHQGWIFLTGFSVEMKEEDRLTQWNSGQGKGASDKTKKQKPQKIKVKVGPGAEGEQVVTLDAPARAAGGAQGAKDKKDKDKKDKKQNTVTIQKPTDSSSCKILAWAQTPDQHDIQIDWLRTEEEWPFMTMIFTGVVPTKVDLEDAPSDSLSFTWKKAKIFSWSFDESGTWLVGSVAEFGSDEAASSQTTTRDERVPDSYTPPPPETHAGAAGVRSAPPPAAPLVAALAGQLPPVPAETQSYSQERRKLRVDAVNGAEFELESFMGEEALSRLFTYDLELRSTETDIQAKDIVGQEISFCIEDDPPDQEEARAARHFHGIVRSFLHGEMASDRRRRYHATVVPTLWKLSQRSDSRVFQSDAYPEVLDIVEKVFSSAGFSDFDTQAVTRSHPAQPYCVQYQETDLAFVSRLLEEAGIFYFFKHEEKKHTLVLCDGSTGYVRCEEDPLRLALEVHRQPRLTSWRKVHNFVPGKYDARDFNFTTPQEPLKGQSTTKLDVPGLDQAEVFEYPARCEDNEQAKACADLRLQEREVEHHFVHGVGAYDSLFAGVTISLENPPGEPADGPGSSQRWALTAVQHRAEQLPEYGLSKIGYRAAFTAIPEDVPFVPPRITPKPRIYGPQTAIVVGDKETDEDLVDTDEYGRIKVQFHWDRYGKKDKDSSCWLRVAHSLAGASWGAVALPRIGHEVLVSFLEGDPDRPLVTGAVYNELHKPHHELPAAKHKTVFMTRSFPGGAKDNFNELTFHDEKDKEKIYLHAERDFERVVEHADVLRIGEKEDGGQEITIVGDQKLEITKGARESTIKSGDKLTVTAGDIAVDVSAGKETHKASSSIELEVGSSKIKIDSSSITLSVGGSTVKIDNTGVALKGMTIKAEGSISAEIKGTMTSITGDGMLTTKGGITMMS
jgi:type VI secretion system secreted protein VgrG